MSTPNQPSRIQYAANGSTVSFPFPYGIYFDAEIVVLGTNQSTGVSNTYVLGTDYTLSPSSNGTVQNNPSLVFGTAPALGTLITIARVVPYDQPIELVEGAGLPSYTLERQLDELSYQIQQIVDQLGRTPSLPITTPIGSVPGFSTTGDYVPYDVSSGAVPQLSFTPGNHRDSVAGVTWTPTVGGGNNIIALPPPVLTMGADDTVVYFVGTINPANGYITALDIEPGTFVPDDTETAFYQLLSNVIVNVVDGVASVQVTGGGVRGSQNYFYCGVIPPVDGSGHLLNS
jgi:hypothetical protein